jgi:transposase InsO family protein
VTVKALSEQYGYPVGLAREMLELPRSSYYYHSQKPSEDALEADMQRVAGQFPTYGTRRMTHELRRSPYQRTINRKRVQRIMRQKGWLRPVKRVKCRTTNSDHPYPRYENLVADLVITQPDQVWVSDITYIRLGQGFVYLAVVMDVFTRAIRGWYLSRNLDVRLSVGALQMGLAQHSPQIHHSDQGIQYAAREYVDLLQQYYVQISMAAIGKPEENGYAERLMRTIKEEEVDLSDYRDFVDAQRQIKRFLEDVYMTKRIHSSLGYLTPAEFETALRPSNLAVATTP